MTYIFAALVALLLGTASVILHLKVLKEVPEEEGAMPPHAFSAFAWNTVLKYIDLRKKRGESGVWGYLCLALWLAAGVSGALWLGLGALASAGR